MSSWLTVGPLQLMLPFKHNKNEKRALTEKKTGMKGIVLTSTEWQLSWLSAPRPSASAIRPLVFGQVRLDSTSGQNTASGQSPSFVAGHISGRCKPSAPSWGLVAPPPWQQPFFPPRICAFSAAKLLF